MTYDIEIYIESQIDQYLYENSHDMHDEKL